MIKSRKIGRAVFVALTGEKKNASKIVVRKPERRDHTEKLGVGGRIILKWILGK
jgi:hypothetical protein